MPSVDASKSAKGYFAKSMDYHVLATTSTQHLRYLIYSHRRLLTEHHVTCLKEAHQTKSRTEQQASEVIIDCASLESVPSISLCILRRTVSFQPFSPAQNSKPRISRRPLVPHALLRKSYSPIFMHLLTDILSSHSSPMVQDA